MADQSSQSASASRASSSTVISSNGLAHRRPVDSLRSTESTTSSILKPLVDGAETPPTDSTLGGGYGAVMVESLEREFEVHDIGNLVDTGDIEPGFSFRKLLRFAGPGFAMSIAYVDPGNICSDLHCGAVAGYKLIWLLFLTHALGLYIQTLSARIGSDIQEAIGTAIALYLLFGIEIWLGILMAAGFSYLILGIQRFGARRVEALFVAMIAVMCVCFGIEVLMAKPDMGEIALGLLVPRIPANAMVQAVGVVGAVIMPHNLFLHSALVGTRKIKRTAGIREASIREANFYTTIESAVALLFSFIINATILIVFADIYGSKTPSGSWMHKVTEQHLPGLVEAADLLQDAFGRFGPLLWAIGLLSSGQSSTATGTMAGQYLMEGMMRLHVSPWLRLFISRSISLIPTMLVGTLATKYLDQFDEWLNVLQSLALPFALVPTLKLAQSQNIMSSEFAVSKGWRLFGWIAAWAIIALNVYLLLPLVVELAAGGTAAAMCAYGAFSLYMVFVGVLVICGVGE
ncbi:hypothetical protein GGI07_000267 [Coemansia sp. Benny D115]|nr:hypothetical protein GGI07_000267 [Coemansia sp. Benny D115]